LNAEIFFGIGDLESAQELEMAGDLSGRSPFGAKSRNPGTAGAVSPIRRLKMKLRYLLLTFLLVIIGATLVAPRHPNYVVAGPYQGVYGG
jgi:hypothetical protein